LDGNAYALPRSLLSVQGTVELPILAPGETTPLILPTKYKRYAMYRLDRGRGVMDYIRTTTL
jgi:hypothetical protein